MKRFDTHKEALEWMKQHPGKAVFVENCNASFMIDSEEPDKVLFQDFGYDYDCFGNYISYDSFLSGGEEEKLYTNEMEENKSTETVITVQ